jgi:DNA replication protein DnaC
MQENYRYQLTKGRLTKSVTAMLQKHYPLLEYRADLDLNILHCCTNNMPEEQQKFLHLDLEFFDRNPSLPLENLCSHLENYAPANSSQEEMLFFARKLVDLDDYTRGAGLYMFGEAGIGKSHIAVGISKKFMAHGMEPFFQFADRYTFGSALTLQPGQVWIIDDMNTGFSIASRLFKQVVLNAHEHGGRVFVTSNKEYDELMKEMFVGDSQANRIRYEDRTRGMFKILHVNGSSHRQANAWYQ